MDCVTQRAILSSSTSVGETGLDISSKMSSGVSVTDVMSDLSMIFSQNSEFISGTYPSSPANLLDTLDEISSALSEQCTHSIDSLIKKTRLDLQGLPGTSSRSESDTLSTYSSKSDSTISTTSVPSSADGLVIMPVPDNSTSLIKSNVCSSSNSCSNSNHNINNNDILLSLNTPSTSTSTIIKSIIKTSYCMWNDCEITREATSNILEHIQNVHVAPQKKSEGYICLWEGCKVFNKKSSSLSWLERHILCHSGNKPFLCIIPGCGLAFGSRVILEKHINSHITTTEMANGNGHSSLLNRKLDSSPAKGNRRKKKLIRKQRLNIGQHADFFDKRSMEYIKHRLVSSMGFEEVNGQGIKFTGEVLTELTIEGRPTQVHVRWYPEHIMPEELVDIDKFNGSKIVPFQQIPKDKLHLLFPNMIPAERSGKASRKWEPREGESNGLGKKKEQNPNSSFDEGCDCDAPEDLMDDDEEEDDEGPTNFEGKWAAKVVRCNS